jgi:hypothetical protein
MQAPESLPLKKSLKLYKDIRHEIKKKRLVFDEGKEKFGMDAFTQLMKVKNTSEVKGYPFKASKKACSITKGIPLAIKIVPIETKYEKYEHPCHIEQLILKELTDNLVQKGISPHITYYLGTQKVSNKSRALKPLNLKRLEVSDKIKSHSSMLISEFVQGGSLDNWIFNSCEADLEPSEDQWQGIVFQLIYTIAVMQYYYKMMHNDFHYGNILIDNSIQPGGYFAYDIDGERYYIKNTGIIPKLWDFEFSMVYSNKASECYPNKFITGPHHYDRTLHKTIFNEEEGEEAGNVPCNYNEVYDLHYFLTSLLDLYISQELFDWILNIYPDELIPQEELTSSAYSQTTTTTTSSQTTNEDNDTTSTSDSSDSATTRTYSESDESKQNTTASSSKRSEESVYLEDGRIINGMEKQFENLPTPKAILKNSFFKTLTTKPDDFEEETAIYFKAGF